MDNRPPLPQDSSSDLSWFNSQSTSATATPPSKRRLPHPLILIALAILLVLGAATALIAMQHKRTRCLAASDFTTLTGVTLTEDYTLSPTTAFYTATVNFQTGALKYASATDEQTDGQQVIQKVAAFYRDHETTSILITVEGAYFQKNQAELARQQLELVSSDLARAGVAATDIQTEDTSYIEPEDEAPDNPTNITISLTSREGCTAE